MNGRCLEPLPKLAALSQQRAMVDRRRDAFILRAEEPFEYGEGGLDEHRAVGRSKVPAERHEFQRHGEEAGEAAGCDSRTLRFEMPAKDFAADVDAEHHLQRRPVRGDLFTVAGEVGQEFLAIMDFGRNLHQVAAADSEARRRWFGSGRHQPLWEVRSPDGLC
jgi:hypothetical protein